MLALFKRNHIQEKWFVDCDQRYLYPVMRYENTLDFARQLDQTDPLRSFRDQFHLPQRDGQPLVYCCGNSLGLQPKAARRVIGQELDTWQDLAVEGWFESHNGRESWLSIHKRCKEPLAQLVGGQAAEVCALNNLTTNLHLMLASFYRPAGTRTKILTIGGDFPSDQYALETHIAQRGLNPAETLIEIMPRPGEDTWQTADLLAAIDLHRQELALVFMSGLHYYTGQVLDMAAIAQKATEVGIPVGFDLAHAIGNVPLQLHHWGVDFAIWCSYKYLNSGPGGVAGLFVHEKHHTSGLAMRRLAGWWGYDEARRFQMTKGFVPMPGADGWQVSTPNVLAMVLHEAALQITAEAGMTALRQKSEGLTGYLAFVLADAPLRTITPADPAQRGCQLSLVIDTNGKQVFDHLTQQGIIGDWREPNCIRLAPTPLYNTFEDVWRVGQEWRKSERVKERKSG